MQPSVTKLRAHPLSTETPSPRHTYFVDAEVQAALLIRASIYGLSLTLYFAITLVCTQWMDQPDRSFFDSLIGSIEDVTYWLPGFLLLVPLAAHDLLKMTNQFAGPMTRLRREMKLLLENKSERPLNFREDDYWVELTSSYNQIRGELLQLRRRVHDMEGAKDEAELPPSLLGNDDLEDTVRLAAPPIPAAAEERTVAQLTAV